MPFQSEKQRRYLWANEPEIARDWTDTYGSRIRKDNGGIMQGGVQNFLGQQPTVNAPKYWQSAPDHEMTELAYITPRERDALVDMDMYGTMRGGPNKGPSGIMSLNGWGSTDRSQERAGADISPAMDRGGGWSAPSRYDPSPDVPSYSTAMSPATLKLLSERQGGDTVLSSGMRNQLGMPAAQKSRGFNPLSFLGGAFKWPGRIASGIMGMGNKFNQWASNMRGGMTQREWEQAKQERIANKRIQNILGRDAPITATTQSNLANLYKQAGTTQGFMPDVGSTGTSRAIADDYTMQDTLREYPFSTNRLEEIQRGWDDQGIAGTQAYEDFSPNVALSKRVANEEYERDKTQPETISSDIYQGDSIQKRIAEQFGYNPTDIALAALNPEQMKKYKPSTGYGSSDMKAAFKNAQNMNAQQFESWIDKSGLGTKYSKDLLNELKFNETDMGKVKMIGEDAYDMIDLPGLGDDQGEVEQAASSLFGMVSAAKNKYGGSSKKDVKHTLHNRYYTGNNKEIFKGLGIDNLDDLDKFIDVTFDTAGGTDI